MKDPKPRDRQGHPWPSFSPELGRALMAYLAPEAPVANKLYPGMYQAVLKAGMQPETGLQYCFYCRTGQRRAGVGGYCGCNNLQCPYPVGMSNAEEKALERLPD